MAYRKFSADKIFDGYSFLDDGNILITDEEGVIQSIVTEREAGDDVEQFKGILSPGFINCHGHLELSHMKGLLKEGTGLVQFVLDVVEQRHFPEEEIIKAIEKAEDEMLLNGIVAAGDICNNVLTIPQKTKGRIYYHNFIEASGFSPQIAQPRFERSVGVFREYAKNYSIPVESNSIVPHAPYSVADELWDLVINFPGNHLFTIHNQETAGENEWFMNKCGELTTLYEKMNIDVSFFKASGKSSLQTYLPKFLNNQSLILVHNVHTSENDILFAKRTTHNGQLFWCLCPNANQYITGQLPNIDMLMKHDCAIVLGTDSLASNHQLSILEEIKTIQQHFPHIEIEKMLRWATSNGAKALQLDALLGSFEKGKRPGIILIEPVYASIKRLA
ncbi:MAG: amidohydrolase family protein [Ferruginibacter sp.]|nr:amidohydrolase family protein [Chitinophagaceae bacterium]